MDISSTLTLSRAVLSLQQACSHLGNMESIAGSLSATVTMAGDLDAYGLSGAAVRSLTHLRNGRVIGEEQSLRALALLAARVGSDEIAAAAAHASASGRIDSRPMDAIRELLSTKEFSKSPKDGFWARMADPTDGFSPFTTAGGTKVAFFPTPQDLGSPWAEAIAGSWENGLGLVAFLNEKSGACGMIFIHGVGRASWSRPERDLWYSSGGSMAFPQERLSFADALTRVVDKGVAMTLKWR
ncbi:MAG TPA: hypothetical protein VFX30_00595, partial [bacterium]|nr:hypothetical protein [bacterium]